MALQHIPPDARPIVEALWMLDAAMGEVVARATDPTLGRIKLAWWRERLEGLDEGPPPAEPRLQAAASHLLPLGLTGAELSELEPGWAALFDEQVDARLVAGRGARLFTLGGRLLGTGDPRLADAGALYALTSVARRGLPELIEPAGPYVDRLSGYRFPRPLRGLTMLARLAVRDLERRAPFEPEGSAGRAMAMLGHRWTGRIA